MSLLAKPNDIHQSDLLSLPHDKFKKKTYKYALNIVDVLDIVDGQFCAYHREEQTCFCLLFVSVIYITLNNFRILPFIMDFTSWSRYISYIHLYTRWFCF